MTAFQIKPGLTVDITMLNENSEPYTKTISIEQWIKIFSPKAKIGDWIVKDGKISPRIIKKENVISCIKVNGEYFIEEHTDVNPAD